MGNDQPDGRHTEKELDSQLRGAIERVIRAAIRSWPATLRLCLLVSVAAATLTIVAWTERAVRAAIRSWPATLRLCLLSSVVAATLTIVACMVYPSVLPLFMG
jgi:hypothetical protein